jgi:Domain of unknown function (DUF5076)
MTDKVIPFGPPKPPKPELRDTLPHARPDVVGFEETLVVHERYPQIIVEISDILTHPESWGEYLGDIAFVISKAMAEEHDITQAEAMALIRKGFNSGNTWLPERVGTPDRDYEDKPA